MSNILINENYNYKFDSSACEACGGNCCTGESGYIWINKLEIEKLALHLNLSVEQLKDKYLEKITYKYSIKEVQLDTNNFACAFFDLSKKQCSIYEARPIQCRTFPFWDYFKNRIEEVKEECPGIKDI